MIRWIPYTFVRIALFFIGGILLGVYFPGSLPILSALGLLIAFTVFYLILFFFFKLVRSPFFNLGYLALAAVFLAGYVHVEGQKQSTHPKHIFTISKPITFYRAVITRYTEEKQRSWKVEAKVLDVNTGKWESKVGNIILYFSKEDFSVPFRYGDVLLIRGSPQIVQPPSNPGEFDYKRFLGFRNIYHQHFLRSGDVQFVKNDPPFVIMDYALEARQWADATLRKYVRGEREQAIASALVLGVTDGLDNELLTAYAATGAMHVLAVSGLHITIVYMILAWLLKPLLRLRAGPWILAVVSLIVLWGYAFVTGLSPSVLRAVTMFSFIAMARPTGQSTNIYNTLAASAFCLLLFDPYLIMSVGFQLSYLAVLGIVYLQPPIYQLWEPRSYLLDQIWKITCVSVAAQVATFGLGLLYFHQFPNYFLLANLLVIPGSFLVLILGIVVLATGFFQVLASFLGLLLTWLIKALNVIVFTVESFPFSLIEDIHITTTGCWLLMAILVSFILLMEFRRFYFKVAAFVFTLFFALVQWQHFREQVDIRKITVYNIHGHSAIDLIDRGQTYFLADSVLLNNADKLRFHIRPNRLASGIGRVFIEKQYPFIQGFQGGRAIRWRNHIVLQILHRDFVLPEKITPQLIIIGNNAVTDLASFAQLPHLPGIILDSSNSYFYCIQMMEQAKNKNLETYSVKHQGAYEFLWI
jgi:competence protein ComEC